MKKFIFLCLLIITLFQMFELNQVLAKGKWLEKGQFLEQEFRLPDIILLKLSKNGDYFYTFSSDSLLRKWNTSTGEIISEHLIKIYRKNRAIPVDISSDGDCLLIASAFKHDIYDDTIKVLKYIVSADSVEFTLNAPDYCPMVPLNSFVPVYIFGSGCTAKFSNDESKIYTQVFLSLECSKFTETGILNQWDATYGYHLQSFSPGRSWNLIISDDDKNIAWNSSVSFDMNLNLKTRYSTFLNDFPLDTLNTDLCHSFTHDSKYLLSIKNSSDSDLIFINTSVNKIADKIKLEMSDKIQSLMISKNDRLAILEGVNKLSFINLSGGGLIYVLSLPDSAKKKLFRLHPANNQILYGTSDGLLRIVNPLILNKALIADFSSPNRVEAKGKSVRFIDRSFENPKNWSWDFGDGQTSSELSPEHVYLSEGSYAVTLIVSNGTISDTIKKENYITIKDKISGIDSFSDSEFFSISPNPATDFIEISLGAQQVMPLQVKIFDVFGQEVTTPALHMLGQGENNPLNPPLLRGNLKIDVSGLTAGLYFVRVGEKVSKFIKI